MEKVLQVALRTRRLRGGVSVDCGQGEGTCFAYLLCGFRDEHVPDVGDVVGSNSENYEHAHELAAQEPECWDGSPAGVAGHFGELLLMSHGGRLVRGDIYIYI